MDKISYMALVVLPVIKIHLVQLHVRCIVEPHSESIATITYTDNKCYTYGHS